MVADPDHDRALFLRYLAGSELQSLADEAGLTRPGLRARWQARGWQLPVRRRGMSRAERNAILELAREGRTIPEIVEATGRQRETVAALLRRRSVRPVPVTRPMLKPDHWRRLLGRLLNAETWRAILGPDAVSSDRKREIRGIERYCERVGIAVPAAARAHLGAV